MQYQRQSSHAAPEVQVGPVADPDRDFGSNQQAARAVGPALGLDTPFLDALGAGSGFSATGDSHEHDEVGGGTVVVVNGVALTTGQINAMGDFVGSVDELYELDAATLLALRDALERHAADPDAVGSGEIGAIVGDRYAELALDNGAHFAGENLDTWGEHHATALGLAQQAAASGDAALADRARATEAFGAHFLTDTFSAGHGFEKQPVMDQVTTSLGEKERQAVVRAVSDGVLARCGDTIDGYEVDTGLGHMAIGTHTFRKILTTADQKRPELLPNTVVRAAHDTLGELGVEVANDHHAPWVMKGDHEMDEVSLQMASQACAASSGAVEAALAGRPVPATAEVLSWVPQPTTDGQAVIDHVLAEVTDPQGGMIPGLIGAMSEEIEVLMEEVVAESDGWIVRKEGPEAPAASAPAPPTRTYGPPRHYGPASTYGPR